MYKDKALQREKTAERVRRYRDKEKGVTSEGVTEQGVTPEGTYFKDGIEMVPPAYVQGITRTFEVLPERPRYLKLSDGQVLDRANQPSVLSTNAQAIKASNESEYNYHPNTGAVPRMKGIKQGLT